MKKTSPPALSKREGAVIARNEAIHRMSFLYKSFCWVIVLLIGFHVHINGQNTRELEAQRKAVLEEIEVTSQLLSEVRSTAQTSLNRLNLLSSQIQARKKAVSLLNQEIAVIDKEITAQNNALAILEKDLKDMRDRYSASVQSLYSHRSSQYKWLFVLSANNFTQIVRRIRYVREIADWQKHQGILIINKQEEVNRKQAALEFSRAEKVALVNVKEEENKQLMKEEAEQRTVQQQLNRRQSALQAELKKQQTQATNLNRQIEQIITNANAGSNKLPGERTAETAGGFRMTPEQQKLSADFASNRGRLPYPLTGRYRIVRPFGEYRLPQAKNVPLKNNGIDIQTTAGTDAQAVFAGVVNYVLLLPGTNYYGVIVQHGNYWTFYVNLSEVYVKSGDRVTTSQRLGKIYTDTKNDNATILKFEIRKEREALNPEIWLR